MRAILRPIIVVIACTVLFVLFLTAALPSAAQKLLTRIIDTGAGHASVTVIPGGFYMVYDTGHWNHDTRVSEQILGALPLDSRMACAAVSAGFPCSLLYGVSLPSTTRKS